MFCLFDKIYVCGVNEFDLLNLNNFNFIINCSPSLNNLFQSNPNYINLNLDQPINLLIDKIIQSLEFIYNCYIRGNKIILLDETGKDNSIFICIMFLMKFYNKDFETIYNSISNYAKIHPKEYYSSIQSVQYFLIKQENLMITQLAASNPGYYSNLK